MLLDDGSFVRLASGAFEPVRDPTRPAFWLFRAPTAIARYYSSNLVFLTYVYSASFAFLPVLAFGSVLLGLKSALPARTERAAFVALSGICLLSLPLQLEISAHLVVLSQVYWILLVCVAFERSSTVCRWALPIGVVLLLLIHPFTGILFLGTGATLLLLARGANDRSLARLGGVFLVAGFVRLALVWLVPSERWRVVTAEHPAHDSLARTISHPQALLMALFFLLIAVASASLLVRRFESGWLSLGSIVAASLCLALFIFDQPDSMIAVFDYQYWLIPLSVPLHSAFLVLLLRPSPAAGGSEGVRVGLLLTSSLFLLGTALACWQYTRELSRVRRLANQSASACVQTTELFGDRRSFLDGWWLPALYLSTEPTRHPTKIVTTFEGACATFCTAAPEDREVHGAAPFFDFSGLEGELGPESDETRRRGSAPPRFSTSSNSGRPSNGCR